MQVKQFAHHSLVSREVLEDHPGTIGDMIRAAQEADRRFRAMPPEEQARIIAERKAAYEAQRCSSCGCHPDEHADR